MKKLSVALVLVLASLALVACGSSGSSSSSEAATTAESTEAESSEAPEGAGAPEPEEEAGAGKSEESSGGAGSTVKFEAEPEGMLMFEEKSATAKAGEDTIEFDNSSAVPHNVAIEDSSGKVIAETETISESTTTTTADLEPGSYTFFCSIPGHREAGMEGTLTVK